MTDKSEQIKAIKALHEKGGFGIGDRKYTFAKMPFKKARKVFSYLTTVAGLIEQGNLSFFDTPKFENEIEPLLLDFVLVDGFKLSTIPDHFEDFTSDYNQFVLTSIQGFSAPFMPEAPTASASKPKGEQVVTLSKPM